MIIRPALARACVAFALFTTALAAELKQQRSLLQYANVALDARTTVYNPTASGGLNLVRASPHPTRPLLTPSFARLCSAGICE